MLPTPDTSHVSYNHVYEPAEDSFLFLDTLSSPSETAFLSSRFLASASTRTAGPTALSTNDGAATTPLSAPTSAGPPSTSSPAATPLLLEVGSGSGVILAFLTAHSKAIFGSPVLTAAVDANHFACSATGTTVSKAVADAGGTDGSRKDASGLFLGALQADLGAPLRPGTVDVLVFNPPYVPTPELPELPAWDGEGAAGGRKSEEPAAGMPTMKPTATTFEQESRLLELSYAGGRDGMETTDRLIDSLPGLLSPRGCAYVLLCAQNRPEQVKARIRSFGDAWAVKTVGSSGRKAGWEVLQIIRIWRGNTG